MAKFTKHSKHTKKQNQIHHALLRAAERFGLKLCRSDLDDIRGMICKNKATFVGRTSLRVSVWDVAVRGIACRVVYDRNRKTIVTFLQPDSVASVVEDAKMGSG